MNDTIRRLLAQAYLEQADIRDTTKIAERFAQLIVEDCIGIAQAGNATAVVDVIKERFGIE